jgi:hypothetical protein
MPTVQIGHYGRRAAALDEKMSVLGQKKDPVVAGHFGREVRFESRAFHGTILRGVTTLTVIASGLDAPNANNGV